MILQKYKKNEIVKAMRAVQLDPREFDLSKDKSEALIKHRPSGAYFTIGGGAGHYIGKYVAGDWAPWDYENYNWEPVLRRIISWLDEVKRDVNTPDLWAELHDEAEFLGPTYDDDVDNQPFNSREKEAILLQLKEFAKYAEYTYSLSVAQMNILNTKLDYLGKAADRLGRIDWYNTFAGVIIGYVLNIALPPDAARALFFVFIRGISLPALPNP